MLGKLLKFEIKHTARYTLAIYIAVAAIAAVMGLSLLAGANLIGLLGCMAIMAAGSIAVVVTVVSVIKNFNDSLYGRQGYLTFTLPVKCSNLLISKVIVSSMWIVISFVVMALTYIAVFFYVSGKSSSTIETVFNVIVSSGLFEEYIPTNGVIVSTIIFAVVSVLLVVLVMVGFIYFSVTLANTRALQAHPKFFGGLVFFGIFTVTSVISNWLTELVPLTFNISADKVFFAFEKMSLMEGVLSYGVGGLIFFAIVATGLLFATGYIMENKVNLK